MSEFFSASGVDPDHVGGTVIDLSERVTEPPVVPITEAM